jgi:hypothetical protein
MLLQTAFSFFRLVSLQGETLNILMAAQHVLSENMDGWQLVYVKPGTPQK